MESEVDILALFEDEAEQDLSGELSLVLKPDSDIWHESQDRETEEYFRKKQAKARREARKSRPGL